MTFTLWLKLLRDVYVPLLVVALLLLGYETLWVLVTERITTRVAPLFESAGVTIEFIQKLLFRGAGEVIQAVLGGQPLEFQDPKQLLPVGYIHPLVQAILCIWAIGRASGAVAGEIDRGTMELLLAQPLACTRLLLAHLAVDLTVIPVLCLSMYAGTLLGLAIAGPFAVDAQDFRDMGLTPPEHLPVLEVDASMIPPGLLNTAALAFALSGLTMWLSARGRFRWWVVGQAVVLVLVMFIINVLGQLWDAITFLRPLSVFYYYQPQKIMLQGRWTVEVGEVWNGGEPLLALNVVAVLLAVGAAGYLLAWRTFTRRDIPAPL